MKKLSEKEALEVYDDLREMHSILKDVLYTNFNKMSDRQQNAVDAVHSVLYLAEGVFAVNE